MASGIDLDSVNRFRLHRQHLAEDSHIEDIAQITRDIYGLHATNATTPYLSLFARAKDFSRDKLDKELYVKKTLGKIRCIRKTVHILPRETIPVAFAATKSIVEPNSADFLRITGGVTQEEYETASQEILKILKGEGMSTALIKKRLGSSLNISLIVNLMCDQGLLMRGCSEKGWKSNTHTYYAFSDYFPGMDLNSVDPAEAREITVRQYLAAYGPATVKDISWWSGFTMTEIRRILHVMARETVEVEIQGLAGSYVILAEDRADLQRLRCSGQPAVNLLPALDPYLMGYKERGRYLDREHQEMVFDRSGNATSVILVNGRAAGIWDVREGMAPTVKVFFFRQPEKKVRALAEVRALDMGRFLTGREVALETCDSMVPLTQRNAGGFMSPLAPSAGKGVSIP
ncbi:MAG: winged helix DNA-binding domain-containing protein [Dehalococcoidia bacterium]|nr:winged helix DNA-binding domain-containing protein [Dehalococcoidia bacterium]